MQGGDGIQEARGPDALLAAIDLWCAFLKAAGSADPTWPRHRLAESTSEPGPAEERPN